MEPADAIGDFADCLRGLKDRTGRSYGALAARLHMSTSTLHRYCNGEAVPADYAPVERFARLCGARPDELIGLHRLWVLADAARHATPRRPPPPTSPRGSTPGTVPPTADTTADRDAVAETAPAADGAAHPGADTGADAAAGPPAGMAADVDTGPTPAAGGAAGAGAGTAAHPGPGAGTGTIADAASGAGGAAGAGAHPGSGAPTGTVAGATAGTAAGTAAAIGTGPAPAVGEAAGSGTATHPGAGAAATAGAAASGAADVGTRTARSAGEAADARTAGTGTVAGATAGTAAGSAADGGTGTAPGAGEAASAGTETRPGVGTGTGADASAGTAVGEAAHVGAAARVPVGGRLLRAAARGPRARRVALGAAGMALVTAVAALGLTADSDADGLPTRPEAAGTSQPALAPSGPGAPGTATGAGPTPGAGSPSGPPSATRSAGGPTGGAPSAAGGGTVPSAARTTPAQEPGSLVWSARSHVWEFGCDHRYLIDRPPGRVAPPPLEQDAEPWSAAHDAVHGGTTIVEATVRGTSAAPVVVHALNVRIMERRTPLQWPVYAMNNGCGGALTPAEFTVDLDAARPVPHPQDGFDGENPVPATRLPYQVSDRESLVLRVAAATEGCDCDWYLEVEWSSGDRKGTTRIDDGGRPFRTSGTKGRPVHNYVPESGGWITGYS